jgi:hypothetical protein
MDKKDIDAYLTAVSNMKAQKYLSFSLVFVLAVSLVFLWIGYENQFVVATVWVSFGYLVIYSSEFILGYPVNKRQLLRILRRQIDNDPKALEYLSQLKSKTQ